MKLPQLTFTRFLAAILIVVFHIPSHTLRNLPAVGLLLSKAPAMVSYFFLLSGFILVVSNASGTDLPTQIARRPFWVNRFARIYPLHLFATVATFLLLYPTLQVDTNVLPWGIATFIPEITLLHAWVLKWTPSLNYPSWSISVEAVFYLIFPFLFQWLIRKTTAQIILFAALTWVINQYIFIYYYDKATSPPILLYLPLFHLSTFICGVCTGILTLRHWQIMVRTRSIITALFLLFLVSTIYLILDEARLMIYYHDGLLAPLFILAILFLTVQQGAFARWLSQPRLVYLGEISYGIYLLQVPVGLASIQLNQRFIHLNSTLYVAFYLGLLFIISALCFEKIETPSRRLLRKWLNPAHVTPKSAQKSVGV